MFNKKILSFFIVLLVVIVSAGYSFDNNVFRLIRNDSSGNFTHPMLVSTSDMIEQIKATGKDAVVMAVNPRSVPDIVIPAIMQAAMDSGSPIIFELAASEMNVDPDVSLKAAYTGMTPAMLAEKIFRYANELGLNVPFSIHGDHTSVKSNTPEAITAAEALVKAEIEAGFSSIALDPSHCMELDPVKLTERLNSLAEEELLLIPGVGEVLTDAIIVHGEFSSLDELRDVEGIGEATAAVIQTYLELKDNIDIVEYLNQFIPEGIGLEVEVGEIGHKDSETGEQILTTVLEAETYIKALNKRGIYPDMLAFHNGTSHGNAFDVDGNPIPQLGINLQRTREIAEVIEPLGVVPAQHGTSGTSDENLNLFPESRIFKANVATNWQNIMWNNLPDDMKQEIITWQWENLSDMRKKYETDAEFLDKTRKYANKQILRGNFGEIPAEVQTTIFQDVYDSAMQYFGHFNSVGLINSP